VLTLLSACSISPLQLERIANIAATRGPASLDPSSTVAPPTVSTAALVKQRSKLRVGIRFDAPPLSRVNAEGLLEGLDVDIAHDLARRWLGSPDNVEFVQVTSASAPRRIEQREVDLALGGLVHTKQAETHADFSLTYLYDGDALLIRTGSFADFAALVGRNVTYIDSSSTFALRDAQVGANITVSLQTAPSYADAVKLLRDGQTDAVVGRWRRLGPVAIQDPTLTLLSVFQRQPIAIMLPQNDSDWASLVNVTLSAMRADGTYNTLYQKWFGALPESMITLPNSIDLQLAALSDTISPNNTLERIRSANAVRIGFNAQADPLATLDANGNAVGFEVDVCRELARRWFQNPDTAQFTALPIGDLAGDLRNGTIDLAIGGIVQTQSNTRLMDYSTPTFQSGVAVAVLQTSTSTDLATLSGKVVGVMQGRSDQALLDELQRARNISVGRVAYPDLATALGALRNGQVDAVVEDQVTLLALVRTATDIRVINERLSRTPIGIAMPANDSALRDFVNLTLQDMFADGTYARLYQQWFGTAPEGPELWPGEAGQSTALIAATATVLPTFTPVFTVIDTPTPAPPPTAAPPPTDTPQP
jgi:ABC-type amino acid transport substrate-binding protein